MRYAVADLFINGGLVTYWASINVQPYALAWIITHPEQGHPLEGPMGTSVDNLCWCSCIVLNIYILGKRNKYKTFNAIAGTLPSCQV